MLYYYKWALDAKFWTSLAAGALHLSDRLDLKRLTDLAVFKALNFTEEENDRNASEGDPFGQ